MQNKLFRVIFYSDGHFARFTLFISEIIWGVALLLPGDSFSRSKTYSGMASIAAEEVWGIFWIISGLLQALIIQNGDYHSKKAVFFAGFNSCLWWFVVVQLYTHVWPVNAVASGDLALALMATWIWIRSGWTMKDERRR